DEIPSGRLGDKFKSEATSDFKQIILEDWEDAVEHEDGTITAENQFADPSRLFICGRSEDGYVRRFGRVSPNKSLDVDRREFSKIWKGDEELEDYEKSYNEAIQESQETDERYGL